MKSVNKKPELKWIPIKDLFIDSNYQRDCGSRASKNNIDYMTENFSWGLCGAIIVFAAGKKFAVVDGQHRVAAATAAGEKEMPCVVVDDQDVKRQAKSFVLINTKRVQVHTLSAFRAAIAAGDEIALRVKDICDRAKIDIPVQAVKDGLTAPRQTQAVGSLMKMTGEYEDEQIIWALNIIPEAYGSATGKMRAMFIKALVEFINRNSGAQADRAGVINVIKDINPKELEEDAKTSVKVQGGKTLNVMVDNIERKYKLSDRRKKMEDAAEDHVLDVKSYIKPLVQQAANLEKSRGGVGLQPSIKDKDMKISSPSIVKLNVPEAPIKDYDISGVAGRIDRDVSDILSMVAKGRFEQPAKNGRWTEEQVDRYIDNRNKKINKRGIHGDI